MNQTIFCARALLPDGWASSVRLTLDTAGVIDSLQENVSPQDGDLQLAGPVLPGMPNGHSHAFQYALVGLTHRRGDRPDSFWTWREAMYDLVEQLTAAQLRAISTMAYLNMLCAGYTHVCEFHYLHSLPADASVDTVDMAGLLLAASDGLGIGLTLLPVLYQRGGFEMQEPERHQQPFVMATQTYLALCTQLQKDTEANPDQAVGYAPHSLRAVGLTALEQIAEAASAADAVVHLHLSEQQAEVQSCQAMHGLSPYKLLHHHQLPGRHWNLVHGTHLSQQERDQAIGDEVNLVICPSTEADLGDGRFPVDQWLGDGGSLAIGSDSNSLIDPATELRMLEYQQRLSHQQRNVLGDTHHNTATRLWLQSATGGGRASGLPLGRIAEGYRADLLVLNADHPRLSGLPAAEALDAWLFSGSHQVIDRVFVAGRERVRAGRLVDTDQQAGIESDYRQAVSQLRLR